MTESPDPRQFIDPGKARRERERELDNNIARNDDVDAQDLGRIATAAEASSQNNAKNLQRKKKEEERRQEIRRLFALIQNLENEISELRTEIEIKKAEINKLEQDIRLITALTKQAQNAEIDRNNLEARSKLKELGINPDEFFINPVIIGNEAIQTRTEKLNLEKNDLQALLKNLDIIEDQKEKLENKIEREFNIKEPLEVESAADLDDISDMFADMNAPASSNTGSESAEPRTQILSFASSLEDNPLITIRSPFNVAANKDVSSLVHNDMNLEKNSPSDERKMDATSINVSPET